MDVALVLFGAGVNAAGTFLYTYGTLRGRTKPNRVTYFLWMIASFIGTAAALAQDVTWAALPIFMNGFGCAVIFLASFHNPKAFWQLRTFDWACFLLSALALILWQVTKIPNIAILFAILSDIIASLPTLRKCWTHPETETAWGYAGGAFSSFTGLVVAKGVLFSEMAFPLYSTLICSALWGTILISRGLKRG